MNKELTAMHLHIADLEKALVIMEVIKEGKAATTIKSAIDNAKCYLPIERKQITDNPAQKALYEISQIPQVKELSLKSDVAEPYGPIVEAVKKICEGE